MSLAIQRLEYRWHFLFILLNVHHAFSIRGSDITFKGVKIGSKGTKKKKHNTWTFGFPLQRNLEIPLQLSPLALSPPFLYNPSSRFSMVLPPACPSALNLNHAAE